MLSVVCGQTPISFVQQTAMASFPARYWASVESYPRPIPSANLPNNSLILFGGTGVNGYLNDVYDEHPTPPSAARHAWPALLYLSRAKLTCVSCWSVCVPAVAVVVVSCSSLCPLIVGLLQLGQLRPGSYMGAGC